MKTDLHIEFAPLFNKHRKEAPLEIKKAFLETLALFLEDQNHPSLRNHALQNKYAGTRSINVTDDWRALYRFVESRIIFIDLGTHEQLYG